MLKMKLKQFKSLRTKGGEAIILAQNSGRVVISSALAKKLNIQHGDRIAFHQDSESPADWYIEPGSMTGFRVRSRGGSSSFMSLSLNKAIKDSLGKGDADRVTIPVASVPESIEGYKPIYAMLTSAVK